MSDAPDPTSDEALVERAQQGDAAAFASLVHRHSGRIHGIALGMLRNEQDARDVVQETFLNVHRHLDGFRGEASFKTWVSRIATNSALMKLRRRRRKPETSLELDLPTAPGEERRERDVVDLRPLADQVHENAELGQQIRSAVEALPDKYREVLLLADYQQMSMQDIGQALDLSIPNVKTRLHRARMTVRAALQDYLAGQR